jgi:sortase A
MLKNIRKGDEIDVTGPQGAFRYLVDSTEVVAPDATEVLRPTDSATLTLITCFPFRYIGNAPDRFIVRGKKIGSLDQAALEEGNHEKDFVSGTEPDSHRRRL